MSEFENLKGHLFNTQQVLTLDSFTRKRQAIWLCQCFKCGNKALKRASNIKINQGCFYCHPHRKKRPKEN